MDNEAPAQVETHASAAARPVELSVVVPTYNESENVPLLIEKLSAVLAGISWEVIFVDDDSRDGTSAVVRRLAQSPTINATGGVRVVQRIGRRGLSSACVEGALASSAPYIAVMDGDLQHDEKLLPKMLAALKKDDTEIVVGSRFVPGGDVGEFAANRIKISKAGARLARLVVKQDLSDPMSGFFMLRRDVFERVVRNLSAKGFKILLDIFASSPKPLKVVELPFTFGSRIKGESKLDTMVAWEYAMLLLDKMLGAYVPVRFLMYLAVGTFGLLVHFIVLWFSYKSQNLPFAESQTIATVIAMMFNYWLNNIITYRDQKLKGIRFIWGFFSFAIICSIGALSNIGVASALYMEDSQTWWVAGIAGGLLGSVWNYAMTSVFTWRVKPAAPKVAVGT
ncbi:MAG TPA: glycosyltransferase family 2 protein [Alphaproteobacteria bacterium]|jgi:dolichol-phosphate mannosyltransferase|nr:glycosyltransferase family 2 protein [Alphaproteobacteria bacterium]